MEVITWYNILTMAIWLVLAVCLSVGISAQGIFSIPLFTSGFMSMCGSITTVKFRKAITSTTKTTTKTIMRLKTLFCCLRMNIKHCMAILGAKNAKNGQGRT